MFKHYSRDWEYDDEYKESLSSGRVHAWGVTDYNQIAKHK